MRGEKHPVGWRRWLIEIEVAVIGTIMILGTVTALWTAVAHILTR